MSSETLADAVFWFHMFWIGLLFLSIPVSLIWPSTQPIQAGIAFGTLAAQFLWGGCPLTTLEFYFRDDNLGSSLTVHLLRKIGIDVHPAVITGSLVVIVSITLFLFLA